MRKTTLTVLTFAMLLLVWMLWFRPAPLGGSTSYAMVSGVSMEPGLRTGDLVIARAQESYAIGDVVVFQVPQGFPEEGSLVVHRIVGVDSSTFVVQGDNKSEPDPWRPTASDIVGRSWIQLPAAGSLLMLLRSPAILAATLAGLTAFWIVASGPKDPDRRSRRDRRAAPESGNH